MVYLWNIFMASSFLVDNKKTKILATLGPTASTYEDIKILIAKGVNGVRLNFSHGTHQEHSERISIVRKIEKELQIPIAIVQDLQGPKIRVGTLHATMDLQKDQLITLTYGEKQQGNNIPVQHNIFPYVEKGQRILINDGIITLTVMKAEKDKAECRVVYGGIVSSHKGINLPDTTLPGASLTDKDIDDLAVGIKHQVDYVAISFVQTAEDVKKLRTLLADHTYQPKIIVKIETKAAITHLEAILQETDAVMIARGDLAVEIGQEEVPIIQRIIIKQAAKYNKPVIVATQMLESMIHQPEPTRAEVNDVATAVLDKVDAVMLSAETAYGKYPTAAVTIMDRIIKRVEQYFIETHREYTFASTESHEEQTAAIAASASLLAHQLSAKVIIALTASGHTAIRLSSYKPHAPIIALTDSDATYKQLTLVWGVIPYFISEIKNNQDVYRNILQQLADEKTVKKNDKIVLVSGRHPGVTGDTNIINVINMGETL
jgi:pyruvate kinase